MLNEQDQRRAEAIIEGEKDGSVFVLFMHAQDVRDHFDGDEEATGILTNATDDEIENLLGSEESFYEMWHEMCRDIVTSLRRERERNEHN